MLPGVQVYGRGTMSPHSASHLVQGACRTFQLPQGEGVLCWELIASLLVLLLFSACVILILLTIAIGVPCLASACVVGPLKRKKTVGVYCRVFQLAAKFIVEGCPSASGECRRCL